VPGLTILSEADYEACHPSSAYRSLLDVHNMENRHCGRLAQGIGRIQILIHLYRHFHQVEAMLVVNITKDTSVKFL
jgi:hypothetical protein